MSGVTAGAAGEFAARFARDALGFLPSPGMSLVGAADFAVARGRRVLSTLALSAGVTGSGTADFAVRDVFFTTTICTSFVYRLRPAIPVPAEPSIITRT